MCPELILLGGAYRCLGNVHVCVHVCLKKASGYVLLGREEEEEKEEEEEEEEEKKKKKKQYIVYLDLKCDLIMAVDNK